MPTVPALTVVAKMAPKEMKAPAKILRANRVIGSVVALFTPLSSARAAIVDGMIASNVISCGGVIEFSGDCFFMASPSPQNNEVYPRLSRPIIPLRSLSRRLLLLLRRAGRQSAQR